MALTPERFLIWGGGGHGKVVADLVRANGHTLVGFVDGDARRYGRVVEPGGGEVVLDQEAFLAELSNSGRYPLGATAVVVAVGDNATRLRCLASLDSSPAPALVHPTACVSPSARVGRGTVVFAGAVVNADARVGDGVIVNSGTVVEHDCVLCDGCHLSPRAVLGGGTTVGARSWIGIGATLIHGIRIGDDVTIGAGAVIIRDVPDGVTVVGNPGRILSPDRHS